MKCSCSGTMVVANIEVVRFVRGKLEKFHLLGFKCTLCRSELISKQAFEQMEDTAQEMEEFTAPIGSRWEHRAGWQPDRQVVGVEGNHIYSVLTTQISKWSLRKFLAQYRRKYRK